MPAGRGGEVNAISGLVRGESDPLLLRVDISPQLSITVPHFLSERFKNSNSYYFISLLVKLKLAKLSLKIIHYSLDSSLPSLRHPVRIVLSTFNWGAN